MKKIFEIFLEDLKNISKSKMAIVILIGIIFIPGIYAWLNIDSNWGPYDNTGNIPVAIVNNDEGTTILGETVNIGNEMEKSLKENNGMKWIFTDFQDAKENVEAGKYYGAIIVPKDFSNSLISIIDGKDIKKPKFDFYINNKKNAIAPIIVNKAVGTIQTNVDQSFVNTIVYKILDKVENLDAITKSVETTDNLIDKIDEAKIRVQDLRLILESADLAVSTTEQSLSAIKKILPTISTIVDSTKQGINDMKEAAKSFDSTYETIEKDLVAISDDINTIMYDSLDIINKTDTTNASQNLPKVADKLDNVLVSLKRFNNTLSSINKIVDLNVINNLDNKIKDSISKIEVLENKINNTTEAITDLDNIKREINDGYNNIINIKTTFQSDVKPELSNIFKKTTEIIKNATNTLSTVNGSLGNVDSSMQYIINALSSGTKLNKNIDKVLANFQVDLDKLSDVMTDVKHSEIYNNIISLLKNKPDEVADFIATPIETNQIDIYPINTYGAKMTPFYSILACWVGCTILTAILKINVKKSSKTEKAKPYQLFFGRFMLFGLMAMLQGLMIGIGDLILQVQTVNWFLLLLTLMFSSLVFVLIIYSLTITFGKVGQALAIVIMVLQVAGSGGTFPIELLPRVFQILQPFMPFHPAMNALRETVGGFYGNDYIIYMLILSCHIIIPLILGLIVRNYTNDIKEKLEEELHDTNVIG